ncbi:SIMPL domain-containing protein [Flavobacterium sp.]|uniref:SIMPL domain-containing protein n=1 Tax=Flavobacterium sp. TaxID=239 RepID=UPI00260EC3F7|nr:SIMPL domain-containing protein [Flavobacterium sp.]MDD2985578.1 SIMPL domain-containing protein [Flavobacterium sp.]
MKNSILILFALAMTVTQAQESKIIPQITVSGEGKISVMPDRAVLKFGIQNSGKEASEVKNLNDETVDKVLKYIKKFGIATTDYKTTQVSLRKEYDYEKKKHFYKAVQSIQITLKDLTKYDELMAGLVETGINNIDNVEFKSSKIEEHQSNARKLAIQDAKKKAEDYVSVLNQKVGKAIMITDNSQPIYPPMYKNVVYAAMASDAGSARETVAIGEIEIITNVNVSFLLE